MAKIISLVNQKGGVGKTTTSVNFAVGLAKQGKKVLLIDMDPQGNATNSLSNNIINSEMKNGSYNLLVNSNNINDCIMETNIDGLKIVGTGVDLSGAEIELVNEKDREFKLKNSLKNYADLDYILIDCPPSLGLLTVNALVASNCIIVPLQCEYFALEGLSHLIRTINLIKENYNEDLYIEGILLTMYDIRNNLSVQVERDVREYFEKKVYNFKIPRNVRLSEAPSHGLSGVEYDKNSSGARGYINFTREFLAKQ